ncbi:pyrroline-5-carboxylate reductase [Chloroflexota bacterium]
MKIAFIGGGNMGEAMIRGILNKGLARAEDIVVSDISQKRRSHLSKDYRVATESDNRQAVNQADSVVLAVKPVSLPDAAKELKGSLRPEQVVISIIAGISLSGLYDVLDHRTVVRAMPNMPAQIGEGVTVWTATDDVEESQRGKASNILAALGKEIFVPDEKYVDMATAVSGSGPAYVFLIIESFIDAAVHIGLPRELAQELVLETVLGSTHLVQKSTNHPAELRNLVTSPGGTTAEGLLQLEEGGLRALLAQAIIAGYEKAKALRGE